MFIEIILFTLRTVAHDKSAEKHEKFLINFCCRALVAYKLVQKLYVGIARFNEGIFFSLKIVN